MVWVIVKSSYMRSPSTSDCEYDKACIIVKYLDINNCSWKTTTIW